jgi:HAD superfamily hydrolase (TIGR01549 family)
MDGYQAVLFDLGNTLIYFDSEWTEVLPLADRAMVQSLEADGIKVAQEEFLGQYEQRLQDYYAQRETEFIKYTSEYILSTLLAEMGVTEVPKVVLRRALDAMYAITQSHWVTEADAIPTLQGLQQRGYRLGLISNAGDDRDVQVLVDKAGMRPFFDTVLTSAAQGIRKPNPRIFHNALIALGGLAPTQAIMVGDTLGADILGAQNAGIASAWITRRADSPANRAHQDTIRPDITIHTLAELLNLL